MQLRPDQQAALQTIRRAMSARLPDGGRCRSVILPASTGWGKTIVSAEITKLALAKGARVLFLAELNTLIKQASNTFHKWGVPHFIWQGPKRHAQFNGQHVLISSPQTLGGKKSTSDYNLPPGWHPDLIIVDEAHRTFGATLALIQDYCLAESAKGFAIGMTATPIPQMAKTYHWMASAPPFDAMVKTGNLVPPILYACSEINMKGATVRAGEWTNKECSKRAMPIIGDIPTEWVKHCSKHYGAGVRSIAFVPTVEYGYELRSQFSKLGYKWECVSYKDGASQAALDERQRKFKLLADHRIDGLISVDALGRGFDVPSIKCVILARPFRSGSHSVRQQMGRGARPANGKSDFLVLDHGGNLARFGAEILDIHADGYAEGPYESPEPKNPGKNPGLKACPKCTRIILRTKSKCPHCGHVFTVMENDGPKMKAGEMLLFKSIMDTYNSDQLWAMCSYIGLKMWSVPWRRDKYSEGKSVRELATKSANWRYMVLHTSLADIKAWNKKNLVWRGPYDPEFRGAKLADKTMRPPEEVENYIEARCRKANQGRRKQRKTAQRVREYRSDAPVAGNYKELLEVM